MKIYLLDRNEKICYWWQFYFKDIDNVEVVCEDFKKFVDQHNVECIVSPANSYGLMDGGYDLAIANYFGHEIAERVRDYILDKYWGEQPVGSSFLINIDKYRKLIHTPTMRIPSKIKDPMVVYHCMRSTLIEAIKNNVESIVIPAFGGDCGDLNYSIISNMMYNAYMQIFNPPTEINWDYAFRWCPEESL